MLKPLSTNGVITIIKIKKARDTVETYGASEIQKEHSKFLITPHPWAREDLSLKIDERDQTI